MRMIHRDEEPGPYEGTCFPRPAPLQVLLKQSCVFCADPFLADEPNPNLTNALDSSLWELRSHKRHYHAGVSTLACIFDEAFTKPSYPLEDFLDHTYATVVSVVYSTPLLEADILGLQLIEGEFKRHIKKDPAVEIEEPIGIFGGGDDTGRNIVENLWTF
jgi:U3 small nucleolar RNA-associated protein 19